MNILLTLNRNYLSVALVMLFSLIANNKDVDLRIYVLSKDLREEDFLPLKSPKVLFFLIKPSLNLDDAMTTKRYPEEMYYRLFAFSLLPDSVDKILYLDPDIIVNGSLRELYDTPLGSTYTAGCSHVKEMLTKINSLRLNTESATAYLNTGVLLMNLALIRKDFTKEMIERTIAENRSRLLLPDQDIMVILFKERITVLDSLKYNLSDRILTLARLSGIKGLTLDHVKNNTVIIHYCGRNKPWREGYHDTLGRFYFHYRDKLAESIDSDGFV